MPATARHLAAPVVWGEDPHRPPDRGRFLQDLLGAEQDTLVTQAQIEAHGIANAASLRTHLHRAARLRTPRPVLTTRRGPRGSLWLLPGLQGPRRGQRPSWGHSGAAGTILVPLTKGHQAVIDAEDWPRVSDRLWHAQADHKTTYATSEGGLRMHTVIALAHLGPRPTERHTVDHISGDGLDNRRANLRWASAAQQKQVPRPYRNNLTGVRGVTITKSGRYLARLQANGRCHHLGTHETLEAAEAAIREARDRYWI